ncbi:alpha/beta hydrolase family protein [Streptomyces hesseae]|uniref:Alpha/beta hydrolase n=1 Tax=Streptomyces hesseae TaxID=3075519 RepID=A0ABU2SEZ7_9ACTN|nr:alpha/beta hydrolase [Streptomyces sp. DSM 40473]MDT0447537.1 alpha/beta hydrolase [Streptomyces sp. DSM 40473]
MFLTGTFHEGTDGGGKTAGISRRGVAGSAVLAGAALLLAGGATPARARQRSRAATGVALRLPGPTGPYRTGVTTLYLVDRSRPDPLTPSIPERELMVTVFYPAREVHGRSVAPQMSAIAAGRFPETAPAVHPGLPPSGVDWAATMTRSYADAPALAGQRPVLLYSPGGGDPRTMGTGLAEELASHGYAVVTVDHPGDAGVVEFPGTTDHRPEPWRETAFRGDPRMDPPLFRTMIDTRVADTRFVLDALKALAARRNPDAAGRPLPEGLGRALDPRRVGAYGHSAGGTTAAELMYEDRRVRAAVDMEGYLDHPAEGPGRVGELYPVARHGVDRPLLLLGTDGFPDRRRLERSWSAMLAHPGGRTDRRQLDRAAHGVFTDYAAFVPQLRSARLLTAEDRVRLVGAVDPAVSVPWVRHHVRSFFARHLPTR